MQVGAFVIFSSVAATLDHLTELDPPAAPAHLQLGGRPRCDRVMMSSLRAVPVVETICSSSSTHRPAAVGRDFILEMPKTISIHTINVRLELI